MILRSWEQYVREGFDRMKGVSGLKQASIRVVVHR